MCHTLASARRVRPGGPGPLTFLSWLHYQKQSAYPGNHRRPSPGHIETGGRATQRTDGSVCRYSSKQTTRFVSRRDAGNLRSTLTTLSERHNALTRGIVVTGSRYVASVAITRQARKRRRQGRGYPQGGVLPYRPNAPDAMLQHHTHHRQIGIFFHPGHRPQKQAYEGQATTYERAITCSRNI